MDRLAKGNKRSIADSIVFLFTNNVLKNKERLLLYYIMYLLNRREPYYYHFEMINEIVFDRNDKQVLLLGNELIVNNNH